MLMRKGTRFVWGLDQMNAFNKVKKAFGICNFLKFFDPKLPTAVETDASAYGIGAVLLQKLGDQWLPVQFISRTLNSAERNYSQIEKEGLSVIFGCEKFINYLLCIEFVLKNDHRPLVSLFSGKGGIPMKCSS